MFVFKKNQFFRFRIQAQSPSYESRRYGSTTQDYNHENNDLDQLFPERTRHKNLSSPTDTPLHVPVTSPIVNQNPSTDNSVPEVEFRDNTNNDEHEVNEDEPIAPNRPHIHSKTKNWYSGFCNRYASLLGVRILFVEF